MTNSWTLRTDGNLFPESYLRSTNRDIAEEYLWPVPVFERFRDAFSARAGSTVIRPGDILEYCGEEYEEYLLVVTVLPKPASESSHTTIEESDRLLTYSSNAETYRVLDSSRFIETASGDRLQHPTGMYAVHEAAAPLIDGGHDSPPDVTHPPLPRVEPNGKISDRTERQFPHRNDGSRITPRSAFAGDVEPINELLHTIHQGDAGDVLRRFPDNSVHGWVTSPPYFQQRDYNADGQLGLEASVDSYLESLLTVVNQLMRVTHDRGLGWIVLDDSYNDGELSGIPERLHQELKVEGYSIVHHSPWVKPNPKPEPVERRLSHAHEYVIAVAHDGADHYFNKHVLEDTHDVFSITVGNTETDHDAVFPVELPKRLIKCSVPERVCAECGEPFDRTYDVTDIRDLPRDRPQAKRALELAEKYGLSDEHLQAVRAVGLGHTGQAKRTQDGTGKNRSEVEVLATEAEDKLGSYAREFTQARKRPTGFDQQCSCETPNAEPGIVLDPFSGSGTTCVAAKQLHRRWAGIELNPDYVAAAEARIGVDVSEPDRLTSRGQETLTSFTQ